MFNLPKDDDKYQWTNHVKDKMIYYRISESLIKRIVRFPKRKEEGIALGTVAVMQSRTITTRSRGKTGKKQEEIWVMYQEIGARKTTNKLDKILNSPKKRIISAWRYPGISPLGKKIPIPDEILQELENLVS